MRVLVATNQLIDYGGSEFVAWEVAEWFAEQGDSVVLAARHVGPPVVEAPRAFTVTDDLAEIDVSAFDLVWSQHDMITRLDRGLENCVRARHLPHIVMVALSPFEQLEHVDAVVARAVGAEVWTNSDETAYAVARANRELIAARRIHRFRNAAPRRSWSPVDAPAESLGRLLAVSHRMPPELRDALGRLRASGIDVRIVGRDDEPVWVRPDDIAAVDAVVSIGKTVVDAIALGRPVYVYDRFGGDGWLRPPDLHHQRFYNFSGRPHRRRLEADALVGEITTGYGDARAAISRIRDESADLRLDAHLAPLRVRAAHHRARLASLRLGAAFLDRRFRSHLATSRRKSDAPY